MRYRAFARIARISQRLEARYTPLGRLLGALTVAAAIFATDPSRTTANLLLAALFGLFVVSAALSLRWAPPLTVTRRFPARIAAGIPTTYHLVVRNDGPHEQRDLRLRDRLRAEFPAAEDLLLMPMPAVHADNWFDRRVGFRHWARALQRKRGADLAPAPLDVLQPGATCEVSITMVPLRRGVLEFAHVDIQRADPLGLRYATRRFVVPQRVLVLPRHFPIAELGDVGSGQTLPSTAIPRGALPGGTEFHALREYRPGDARRHIHWRASARRGVHVVKQFVDGYREPLRILLDPQANPAVFEALIEVAASLVIAATRQAGNGLVLEWLDSSAPSSSGGAATEAAGLLEALALRTAVAADIFEYAARRHTWSRHETAIFVTGCWDPARRAFNARMAATMSRVCTIVVVDDRAPPPDLPTNCTEMRPRRLAEDLRRFTLAGGTRA